MLDSCIKGSGMTNRKHLEQIAKSSKVKPVELERSKKRPEALGYLWNWYQDLKWSSPLTFSELKAWAELTLRELSAFEVDVLMKLDKLFRNHG